MLPKKMRQSMFESLSNVTMREFFHPPKASEATGLVREVLDQSREDFFINGTITSQSACPDLMAGMWCGGREASLVGDRLPAPLKKAMGAALSQMNACPYCEDMLLSLTHGAREGTLARAIRDGDDDAIGDPLERRRIEWARACFRADSPELRDPPFAPEELPEAIGTMLVFSYTNKITDVTMTGSPVPKTGRALALRMFGKELEESAAQQLEPGRALDLLEPADLPDDLAWAAPHPRVAEAVARWAGAVERRAAEILRPEVRGRIAGLLEHWQGGPPPISRMWVEDELGDLEGADRDKARLVLLAAKAAWQIDDGVLERVQSHGVDEAGLVKLGAFGAFSGARRVCRWVADAAGGPAPAMVEEEFVPFAICNAL